MTELTVRPAVPTDVDSVLALCRQFPLGPLPARALSAEVRLEHRLARQAGGPPGLVAVEGERMLGCLGLQTDGTDSITAQPQARVTDFAAPPDVLNTLLDAAATRARAARSEYLIVFVDAGDEAHETLFRQRGFILESHRIAKVVAPPLTDNGRRAHDLYRFRLARNDDVMAMALLSTMSSHLAIPAGREVDAVEAQQRFMEALLTTSIGDDMQILLAENLSDGDLVGYLKVQLCIDESVSPEIIGYIQDFTVHPEHFGMASHLLQYQTEILLQARGTRVLVGDISAANPRSLSASTRKAGFTLEANRWGLRLQEI